jgi:hypothetical protein
MAGDWSTGDFFVQAVQIINSSGPIKRLEGFELLERFEALVVISVSTPRFYKSIFALPPGADRI